MSYKALYRTYRPQIFSDVTGQEVVVQTLQNAIKNNKISHAYLFSGPRGTGKTSVARIFAKALNCSNLNEGEPCDQCVSCNEISMGINPDVIEIDAASNNGVDEIRDIREKVKFLPSGSKYKVYIIDEVHMLSGGAFNALLKTLEEPPRHVIFILATTEPQKLPATIISRCQRFEFKSLSVKEISQRLQEICSLEEVSISDEALNSIGESAEGAMRDALSILDQAISYGNKNIEIEDINGVTGSLGFDKIITLTNAIENKNVHQTLELFNELISEGKEVSKIINSLLVFYRDVLLYKSVGDNNFSKYIFTKDEFKEYADKIILSKVMYFIDSLCDIQSKVKYSTTPNMFLEISLIKMCNVSIEELDVIKRLNELENKFNNLGDISNINQESEVHHVDNEKINTLELRVNQVINELNRLEIRKQLSRIDELYNLVKNSNNMQVSAEDTNVYKSDISYLKAKIEEIELFVNKDENERVEELENKISLLEQKMLLEKDDSFESKEIIDLNDINITLEKLQEEIKLLNDEKFGEKISELQEDVASVKDDIDQIKEKLNDEDNELFEQKNKEIDFSEISEKLMFLEKRIYQIIAGELSHPKNGKKEPKKTNGQIMLFGEEVLSVNDFEVSKEKYDFGDLEKEKINVEESKVEAVSDDNEQSNGLQNNEMNEKENVHEIECVQSVESIEELANETNDLLQEQETHDYIVEEVEDDLHNEQDQQSSGLFESDDIIQNVQKNSVVEEESNYFALENNQDIIQKEKSTLVIDKKSDSMNTSLERHIIALESEDDKKDQKHNASEENAESNKENNENMDKFSKYDVKDVEQILHDSRSMEARNDKARIEQVWKNMTRGARPENLSIIETLQDGKITVVGNKEFIIVFANVSLCNIVMRKKFKETALKIIYDLLGDKYNYIALPVDIWTEKSIEYKQQYQIGVKYPKLKPMVIPGLDIKDDFETDKEKTINQTIELFGDGIVEIE